MSDLKIMAAHVDDDGQYLHTQVIVHNTSKRTLHAYATQRALRYDAATRTLEVLLSDRGLRDHGPSGSFILPRFASIDPKSECAIELKLPRTLVRLQAGPTREAPDLVELPVHEAEHLAIEIAYSGTPYYRDPRPTGAPPRARMVAWAQDHAVARVVRRGAPRAM
jgi:hypothetical protein